MHDPVRKNCDISGIAYVTHDEARENRKRALSRSVSTKIGWAYFGHKRPVQYLVYIEYEIYYGSAAA